VVLKALEEKRTAKAIGGSLSAKVLLRMKEGNRLRLLKEYESQLPMLFIVSQVELAANEMGEEIAVEVEKAEGAKCQRCWQYSLAVGRSAEHPTLCQRCVETLKNRP
jgi:isoleucyl-tRNA synthetase